MSLVEESEYYEMVHTLNSIPSVGQVIGNVKRNDFLYISTKSGIPLLYRWNNGENQCITPGDEPITGIAALHDKNPWVIFAQDKDGKQDYWLNFLDYSTNEVTPITKGIGRLARLFWVTDESWLVSGCDQKEFYIKMVYRDGGYENLFTTDELIFPDYDEKRKVIAVVKGEGPGTRIGILDIEGNILNWISESDRSEDRSACLYPEKGYVAYVTDVSGSQEVVVRALETLDEVTRRTAPGDIVFLRALRSFDAVFASIAKDGLLLPYMLTFDGEWSSPLTDISVFAVSCTKNGCVCVGSSFDQPDCIQGMHKGKVSTLVASEYTGGDGSGESHWYPSFDGRKIQGWLLRSKKDAPLVVYCHGGPSSAVLNMWSTGIMEIVLAGYHVFAPNFRGSATFGTEFKNLNIKDLGGGDLQDVLYGGKYAQKILNTKNPFLVGISYGGYLALQGLTTQPDEWGGGVAIIPIVDYAACYSMADAADRSFISSYFGGTPEENPSLYEERSPITHVDRLKSPVLIIAGENDPVCPLEPIRKFSERARTLNLPVRLEILKGEGHVPARVSNAIRMSVLELEFLKEIRDNYVR
jgi:pimeloyl-ACP methyl ester carboxylesterase